MQRTFKSKIDKWYHLLIWGVLALVFYFFWQRYVGCALTMLIVSVFLLEALFRTDYVFPGDGYLSVKCGFMPRYKMPVKDIREIRYVHSNRLAYALSSDRLLLVTDYDTRMISPENKEDFIKELRKYNSLVVVTDGRNI
ncbi:MAG: PH domain-containing protein [Bacteroidales bacterium]